MARDRQFDLSELIDAGYSANEIAQRFTYEGNEIYSIPVDEDGNALDHEEPVPGNPPTHNWDGRAWANNEPEY